MKKKKERETLLAEELEQAKNDFYSGNMHNDSSQDSQEIEESDENEEELEIKNRIEEKENIEESDNFQKELTNEEIGDFNEEEWLNSWAEMNPEVEIPEEKFSDKDEDLEPGFDLEAFEVR